MFTMSTTMNTLKEAAEFTEDLWLAAIDILKANGATIYADMPRLEVADDDEVDEYSANVVVRFDIQGDGDFVGLSEFDIHRIATKLKTELAKTYDCVVDTKALKDSDGRGVTCRTHPELLAYLPKYFVTFSIYLSERKK